MTTKHMTGTRQEWLTARLELLEVDKELTRRSDELPRRLELPWLRIDKEYRFGPDYTAGCPSCSAIADRFNGFVVLTSTSWPGTVLDRATIRDLRQTRRAEQWWRMRRSILRTNRVASTERADAGHFTPTSTLPAG